MNLLVTLATLSLSGPPCSAAPDGLAARVRVEQAAAEGARQAQDYATALEHYECLRRLTSDPAYSLHSGQMLALVGRPVHAMCRYDEALGGSSKGSQVHKLAKERRADAEASVARVRIGDSVPWQDAQLRVEAAPAPPDGCPPSAPARELTLAPGVHRLSMRARGRWYPTTCSQRPTAHVRMGLCELEAEAMVSIEVGRIRADGKPTGLCLAGSPDGARGLTLDVLVVPGSREMTVFAPGFSPLTRRVEVPAGGGSTLFVDLARDPKTPSPEAPSMPARELAGWITAGVAAGALLAGSALIAQGVAEHSAVDGGMPAVFGGVSTITQVGARDAIDRGNTLLLAGGVSMGVSGAALATALGFLLTGADPAPEGGQRCRAR